LGGSKASREFTLKTFHVYHHPARGYESVPEGICLPALCLSVFWLAFRGLAVPAAVVVAGGALLAGAELTAGRNSVDEVQAWAFRSLMVGGVLVLWLMPFLYGNRWRHADLLRRGFAQVACLRALSGDDAIARALSLEPVATLSLDTVHAGGPAPADQVPDERQGRRERRSTIARAEARLRVRSPGTGTASETILAAR
jgi:hypothetical protein